LSSIGLWIRMEGGFNACGPNFNRTISGSMPRNDEIVPAKKNRKELRALASRPIKTFFMTKLLCGNALTFHFCPTCGSTVFEVDHQLLFGLHFDRQLAW